MIITYLIVLYLCTNQANSVHKWVLWFLRGCGHCLFTANIECWTPHTFWICWHAEWISCSKLSIFPFRGPISQILYSSTSLTTPISCACFSWAYFNCVSAWWYNLILGRYCYGVTFPWICCSLSLSNCLF